VAHWPLPSWSSPASSLSFLSSASVGGTSPPSGTGDAAAAAMVYKNYQAKVTKAAVVNEASRSPPNVCTKLASVRLYCCSDVMMAFAATVSVLAVWALILPAFKYVCTELTNAWS